MPKVSVIIPTFNRERFVGASIESVLSQTYKDREVIVVDDGSTDNTQRTLAAFGDSIRVVRQDNLGVSVALNRGLAAAKGEWISFLDSDDEWLPGYLELQMQRVAQHPNIITHITNACTIQLDKTREDLFQSTRLTRKFGDKEYILLDRPLSTIIDHRPWFRDSMVMRRDILSTVGGFDPALRIAEDLDVIAKMALRGPFSICRKVMVHAFRREEAIDNLVAQAKKRGIYTYRSFGKVYGNLLGCQGLNVFEKIAIRRAQSHNWRALGNVLVIAGRKAEGKMCYTRSILIYPSVRSIIKSIATLFSRRISVLFIKDADNIMPGDDTEVR